MQQMPERPDTGATRKRKPPVWVWVVGVLAAVGLIGMLMNQPQAPQAAVETKTVTATPEPETGIDYGSSAEPTTAPEPTVAPEPTEDPMDAAIADLKSEIFIIKHCNLQHETIADLGEATTKQVFLKVINDADTARGDGTIGGSWLDVSARHQIGVSALYDEVMFRFC